MALAEKPPPPPPFDMIANDPIALYDWYVQLVAYLERLRAAIP